jgi:iron complex outermembrane recepter protein
MGMHASRIAMLSALLSGSILGGSAARAADAPPAAAAPDPGTEIVVTAQKRAQYLQDVPISLEAFSAKKLEENQISSFDDYAKLLPSVSFQSFGPGQSQIYFRGVSSGADANGSHSGPQPTSALYVDEIPMTTIGGAPDLHIYDMERVEALSGPQGTLYGSSSLSGTLRLITNKPNPNKIEAGIDLTGTTFGKGSNSSGGTIEGFINLPLAHGVALRASAFYERDGGYISNVPGTRTYSATDVNGNPITIGPYSNAAFAKKNFNDNETAGGRAALGIDLDENWHIEPSVIYQHQAIHGTYLYDPNVGDLQVQDFTPDYGTDQWVQAALTVHGKIGNWDLTYAGGYFARKAVIVQDYSAYTVAYDQSNGPSYASFFDQQGNNINPTQNYTGTDIYSKLSNELRISSPSGEKWHLTGGVFLERQTDKIFADYSIPGLANAQPSTYSASTAVPTCGDDVFCTRVYRVDRDYAGFVDGSYDILSNLTLDAGIRYFITNNSLSGFSGTSSAVVTAHPTPGKSCIYGVGSTVPCTLFAASVNQHGETHKVNLSWKVLPDKMVYFTYSTGFRPGGINRIAGVGPYGADKLDNFELGAKTEWFDRKLTVNVAGFIENWHDMQFGLAPAGSDGVLATYNVGEAQIKGIEGNFNLRLSPITLSGSGSYIDAHTNTPFCSYGSNGEPSMCAPSGTQLPIQPKFKGNVTVRYDVTVDAVKGWFQVSANHQSSARQYLLDAVTSNDPLTLGNSLLPYTAGFSTVDISLGVKFSRYTFEAFVQNAFDERGVLSINPICVPTICGADARNYPIKPQEFGLKLSARY